MRSVLALLFFLVALPCLANPVFDKLRSINHCWAHQKDINKLQFPENTDRSDKEWIRLHLQFVEQTLRSRNSSSLTVEQIRRRSQALNYLHQYWQAGNFPINEDYTERTPIFIDKHDNFCAVGYLVKATGYEAVSRKIAANTNLAYVKDMHYPELSAWAKEYGFTIDELAWIQPTYGPCGQSDRLGYGANGEVMELYVDTNTQRLYVGGSFSKVDSTVLAKNIAYITEANNVYTWHNIGSGVHGDVKAIAAYGGNIFAGGIIDNAGGVPVNNIAYWNGIKWQAAGCLNGLVKDLIVYQDSLYVCGNFNACNAIQGCFAVWTGTSWRMIPGITGIANTFIIKDGYLYLGGRINYNSKTQAVVKWQRINGFHVFNNTLKNEVTNFDIYHDTLYASCKFTSGTDTVLFSRLTSNYWDTSTQWRFDANTQLSINAICSVGDTFMAGGDFHRYPQIGTSTNNTKYVGNPIYWPIMCRDIYVDNTINCMARFKNKLVFGGEFTIAGVAGVNRIGIVRMVFHPGYLVKTVVTKNSEGCVKGQKGTVTGNAASGTPPYKYLWSNGDTTVTNMNLLTGNHWLLIKDKNGTFDTAKFTITNVSIDTGVRYVAGSLVSREVNAKSYSWLDCDNKYAAIPGATYPLYKPTSSGRYAVAVTKADCMDTSSCMSMTVTGVQALLADRISIYPNPANEEVNIEWEDKAGSVDITLSDVTGRIVLKQQRLDPISKITLDIKSLSPGLYTINIKDGTGRSYYYKMTKK